MDEQRLNKLEENLYAVFVALGNMAKRNSTGQYNEYIADFAKLIETMMEEYLKKLE